MPFCLLSIWCSAGYVHKHKGFCVLVCVVVSCCIVVCIAAALCGAMGHWNVTTHGGKGVQFLHCQHQGRSRLIESCAFWHTYSCAFFYTLGCACLLPLHMVVLMSVRSLQEKPFTVWSGCEGFPAAACKGHIQHAYADAPWCSHMSIWHSNCCGNMHMACVDGLVLRQVLLFHVLCHFAS